MRVERRRLTIALMYGIITAEKEFLRSRIFDFLISSISHRNELDHSFDHLRIRTMWKQCLQEHPKASFSDTKAPKSLVNQAKNRCRFLWEQDAAGSNPVTRTKDPKSASVGFGSLFFRIRTNLNAMRASIARCSWTQRNLNFCAAKMQIESCHSDQKSKIHLLQALNHRLYCPNRLPQRPVA